MPPARDVPDYDRLVREKARQLGFEAVGVARADVPLAEDYDRYLRFIEAGMHGEMAYLADAAPRRRLDHDSILEGAKSVICVARLYQRSPEDEANDPELAQGIARYARGRDYHNFIRKKLRRLAAFVRTLGTESAPVDARPFADSIPVLERAWAARAGLGFVGKNGLIIVPGRGSMLLLGEVVTTLRLTPDAPLEGRCGECRLCLDACPTSAFDAPFFLDPRRCISYLTIESRAAPPEPLRSAIGAHLFGCDACQTVCPFNATPRARGERVDQFRPHERWGELTLEDLVRLDEPSWDEISSGTPIARATRDGMARNAAVVLGNTGSPSAAAVLERAAAEHESAAVREVATWAGEQVRRRAR